MKRHLFTNTALNREGKPLYEVVYKNKAQDPSEVAKSKRYRLEREETQTNNVTDDTAHRDFATLIEQDWEYGKTKFILTYGILVSLNTTTRKKYLQFAGYWA